MANWFNILRNEVPNTGEKVLAYVSTEHKGKPVVWDGNNFIEVKNGRKVIVVASHWQRMNEG